jgi:hypothetical protein
MPDENPRSLIGLILAVIGGIAVLGALGMWLMPGTMMSGPMMGGGGLIGLLILVALVALVVMLVRQRRA